MAEQNHAWELELRNPSTAIYGIVQRAMMAHYKQRLQDQALQTGGLPKDWSALQCAKQHAMMHLI